MTRRQTIVIWTLTLPAVLVFGAAGIAKLIGAEPMVEIFTRYGFPLWFMTMVGAGEVVGAIGLLVAPVASLAGLGLATITFGAVVTHLINDPLANGIPALVLLVLSLLIAYLRARDLTALATRMFMPR